MGWRGRLETTVAVAMLPVGIAAAIISALASAAVVFLALRVIATGGVGWPLVLAWSLAATLVSVRNILLAIKMLNGLDWRPLPEWVIWSGVALLSYAALL